MTYTDYRGKGHKGTYIIFWETTYQHLTRIRCEIYSSEHRAFKRLLAYPFLAQSLHDSFGRLLAYTEDGKVVHCHAQS